MLKKTITYTDFNEEEVSEDFFFHLTEAELVELEMGHTGGLSEALKRIIASEDNGAIIDEFKNIILSAYGVRSADGKRFIKNDTTRSEFASTRAYSTLFMELVTNTEAAVEFVNSIVPKGLAARAEQLTAAPATPLSSVPNVEDPPPADVAKKEAQIISRAELMTMTPDELALMGSRISSGEVRIAD